MKWLWEEAWRVFARDVPREPGHTTAFVGIPGLPPGKLVEPDAKRPIGLIVKTAEGWLGAREDLDIEVGPLRSRKKCRLAVEGLRRMRGTEGTSP